MKNSSIFLAALVTCFTWVNVTTAGVALGPYPVVTGGISHGGSAVGAKVVSNDNRRVVFVADIERPWERAIYMTPIAGGTPVRLSPRPNPPGYFYGASNPYITGDSRRVLFTQRSVTRSDGSTLYVSPITGSTPPIELIDSNQPIVWWPAADDEGVYFWENSTQLSYVPIRGGAYQVVAQLPAGVDLDTPLLQPLYGVDSIAAGDQVLVLGSDSNIYRYLFGQSSALFTKVNNTNLPGLQSDSLHKPTLSPDGSHLLLSDLTTRALYTISLHTGQVSNVSPRVNSGQDFRGFEFSPDSSRVVYVSDRLINSKYEIFSSTIDGAQIINLSPSVIPAVGLSGEFRFLGSSDRVIFQGQFTGDVYLAPINGATTTERLCDCDIYQRSVFESSDDTVILSSEDGLHFYSSASNSLLPLRTGFEGESITFVRWIKPDKTLLFGVREINDEGGINLTLHRSSLHANGASTASIFETTTNRSGCAGIAEFIIPQNKDFIALGVTDKSCEKLAYFKVANNDRKVSQVSKYFTFNNTGYTDYHIEQKPTIPNFTSNNAGFNPRIGYSPRGTHLFVPANRRGVGFWGIDLRREIEVDETLCFPAKAHNEAVTQICF